TTPLFELRRYRHIVARVCCVSYTLTRAVGDAEATAGDPGVGVMLGSGARADDAAACGDDHSPSRGAEGRSAGADAAVTAAVTAWGEAGGWPATSAESSAPCSAGRPARTQSIHAV